MGSKIKILIIEHDPNDIDLIRYELEKCGIMYESKIVQNEPDFRRALEKFIPNIILSDYSLPSFDGRTAFKIKETMAPDTPFIFVSGTIGEENAVELIKNGVTDYVLKDKLFALNPKIIRALEDTKKKNEKKLTDQKLYKANNLYAFISQVNQNIVRVKDEPTLFRNSCNLAIEFGKFKMAWIGLFDYKNEKISLVEQCGIKAEDLDLFAKASYQHAGPQEYVIRNGSYFVSNDINNDPELLQWNHFALDRGLNSCMVFPIRKSGAIIGTINLYSTELYFSGKEEINLLEEVTNDISFALDIFEKEERHTATEGLVIKNEKRFRALIEKSTDMKTLTDKEGNFHYASPSITKVLGYTSEEVLRLNILRFIHPDDLGGFLEKRLMLLKSSNVPFYFQTRFKHKNCNWVWCEGSITNMLNEPDIHALVSNFSDISEKKIVEGQRDFDRNNLNALINTTNDLMWSVDKDFNLLTYNLPFDETIKRLSGKTIEKGANIFSLGFPEEQTTRFKKHFERAFSGETFTEIESSSYPVEIWSEISYYPIRHESEIMGTACNSRNITERKRTEFEREKMIADILQRNKNFEQFAFIVSHNLRGPIANILGISSILKGEVSHEDRVKAQRFLLNAVEHLDGVIKDMVKILQVRTEITESKELVSFSELADDIMLSIQNLMEKEGARILLDFSEIDKIAALKTYMHSIFYNLISNSIKYRKPDKAPIIQIKSTIRNGRVVLSFKDNGRGMDVKQFGDKIFGLYQRFHLEIHGKGMGLFMVKTQVEVLGGTISVKSEPDSGAEFIIELPL